MRVLVCGGRNFDDTELVGITLDAMNIHCVIEGGANGADSLARHWAYAKGIEVSTFPANWGKYGRRAGPIRNQQMIDEARPDLVVAFPGGKGTEDMINRARRAKIVVIEVSEGP